MSVLYDVHWTIFEPTDPLPDTRLHFILRPDESVTDLTDLSVAAQVELWDALRWIKRHNHLTSYGLAVRNGEGPLEVHVLVGDTEKEGHRAVRFEFGGPRERSDG
jgi:diadenosine tetraphosphate (Ap4A) HIT family hydrolase